MDCLADWADQVRAAQAAGERLAVCGGCSKQALAPRRTGARVLQTRSYDGVLDYEPTELVVTARAGTPLAALSALLASHGQVLPFEPPRFGADATVGGTIACGYAGPARAWCGGVRDAVLGVRMINGLGEDLRFGGKVMKNVAGYDLARLQVGAYGRLGVLCELSLKVLPAPQSSATLRLALDRDAALARLVALQRHAAPLTGSLHLAESLEQQALYLRLAGDDAAVSHWVTTIGGDVVAADAAALLWDSVREQQHVYFTAPGELWRWHLPANAPYPSDASLRGDWCTEWGGGLRWLRADSALDAAVVDGAARQLGGFARRWQPFAMPKAHSARAALETRLVAAFDPAGVFAPDAL